MHLIAAFAQAALLAASAPTNAHVSGIYIGATSTNVQMVQLVRTPDGHLAGRIESVDLDRDGGLRDTDVVTEGASDGAQVTLASKSLLLPGAGASGYIDGDLLDFAWKGGHQTLRRGDAYAFEAAVSGLKARSAQLVADRQARDAAAMAERQARDAAAARQNRVQALLADVQEVQDGVAHVEEHVASTITFLNESAQRYASMSRRVRRGRFAEEFSRGFGQPTLWAMQQGGRAQELSGDLDALRSDVLGLHAQADGVLGKLAADVSRGQLACRSAEIVAQESGARACYALSTYAAHAQEMVEQLNSAFQANDRAYAEAVHEEYSHPHLLGRILGLRQAPVPQGPPSF